MIINVGSALLHTLRLYLPICESRAGFCVSCLVIGGVARGLFLGGRIPQMFVDGGLRAALIDGLARKSLNRATSCKLSQGPAREQHLRAVHHVP